MNALLAREEGVPGFIGVPTRQVRYAAVRDLAVAQLDVRGGVPVRARIHGRHRVETLSDPGDELVTGGARTALSRVGADVHTSVAPLDGLRVDALAAGALDVFGSEATRTVARVQVGALIAPVSRLKLAPAVSAVLLDARGTLRARKGAVLPRLGVVWTPIDALTLRANAARTFRPPDPTELFGNRGALAGRPDLRPERGTEIDLGARLDLDGGALEAGVFQSDATDLIVYVQNAQQVAIPTNLGRTVVRGVESAVSITGVPWLDWQTNATVLQSVNRSEPYVGNELPRIPRIQIDQRTAWVGRGIRVGHTFHFTDGVWTDAANLFRQAPRPIHGLFARIGSGRFTADIDVLNLLDTRTQRVPANPVDRGSTRVDTAIADFVGYPLPGRTLLVSLRFTEP